MPDQHVKVTGVWKRLKVAKVKVAGAWKTINRTWVKIAGVWKLAGQFDNVPVGGIILFDGTVIPAGFTRLSAADGRMIVGAGSSYNAGDTGGADTTVFSGSTNNAGSHTGGAQLPEFIQASNHWCGDFCVQQYRPGWTRGDHSHTFATGPTTTVDVYKDFILLQATEDKALPEGGILLSATDLTGSPELTNTETSVNRFARGAATYGGTGGFASDGFSGVGLSTSGSHRHGIGCYEQIDDYYTPGLQQAYGGSHSHSLAATWTLGTYGRGLSAWRAGAGGAPVRANGIMMWPNASPPAGYNLCDGTNGTPDMRDHFLKIVDIANNGVEYGNSSNQATVNYSTDNQGTHTHVGPSRGSNSKNSHYHNNPAGGHTHDFVANPAIVQSYYALTFIQKAA